MIRFRADTAAAIRAIPLVARQVQVSAADALNRTAEDFLAVLRREVPARLTIRDQRLMRFVAPVRLQLDMRATPDRLVAMTQTEGIGRLLNPFQEAIPKRARSYTEPLAIPTQMLRHTPATVIPRKWYPQNLGLQPKKDPQGKRYYALGRGAIAKGKTPFRFGAGGQVIDGKVYGAPIVQIRGKLRTFVLDPRVHIGNRGRDAVTMRQWGVYVRIGPKRSDIRMIWRYIEQVPRPRRLEYYETARQVFDQRYRVNFNGVLAARLRAAR